MSEAINSMFRWYNNAEKCYVYLSDVATLSTKWREKFQKSVWFRRGWTLQELIAPPIVEFFTHSCEYLGDKKTLEATIHEITRVPVAALRGAPLEGFDVEERMSWAYNRKTKRDEDRAYSLLGIFNVHMPLLYGEGKQKVTMRLRYEIHKTSNRAFDSQLENILLPKALGGASSSSQIHQPVEEHLDDQHRQLLLAFSSRYSEDKDFNPSPVPDTCKWFLEDPKFCCWRDSQTSTFLWISAGPGCGKSVLSKYLIDEILVSQQPTKTKVCYFFFKDGQEGRQSGADALTAILHQLYSSNLRNPLIRHAVDKFNSHGKSLTGMLGELWKILLEFAKDPTAGEIICVVDALDECEQHARRQFLEKITEFYSKNGMRCDADVCLKFLVTSRPYQAIQSRFEELSNADGYIHFDADENYDSISQDINKVIDYRLPRVLRGRIDQDGQLQLASHLKATKDRTYLWMSLMFDVMETKVTSHGTEKRMRNLINELPSSISAAYEQILKKSSDAALAKTILQIILAARRPLTVPEMNVALEIARNDACSSYRELDLLSEHAFKSEIRNICGLFVTIHDSQIYLIHQTAREFLLAKPEVTGTDSISPNLNPQWEHSLDILDAETLMTKICTTLLCFEEFSAPPKRANNTRKYLFLGNDIFGHIVEGFLVLEYSSMHWVSHYALIPNQTDQVLLQNVWKLLDNKLNYFQTWFPIFCIEQPWNMKYFDQDKLSLLCTLGLHNLVEEFLEDLTRAGGSNREINSGLWKASHEGHKKVVRTLLDAGADANAEKDQLSALATASYNGHEAVVQMLLNAGADVNLYSHTGFCYAAIVKASESGQEKIVQMLLDAGADIDAGKGLNQTALQNASQRGNDKVVGMLLNAGADVNAKSAHGWTAVRGASAHGHEKIVRMLLDARADVHPGRESYVSTLEEASRTGNDGLAEMMLKSVVDKGSKIGLANSALIIASREGQDKVVRILLDAGADVQGGLDYRPAALIAASAYGHEKIVQMLLDAGADMSAAFGPRVSALAVASGEGHEKVVRILLEARPDVHGGNDFVPAAFKLASKGGHKKVIQMLREAEADLHVGSDFVPAAPEAASNNGHEMILQVMRRARRRRLRFMR